MTSLCYYCGAELIKDIRLVTFYTKDCYHCKAQYFFNRGSDKLTMIILKAFIRGETYTVNHDIGENRIRILQRRKDLIWKNNSAEVLPIEIIRFSGDFNTINPSNLEQRLRTILTFL